MKNLGAWRGPQSKHIMLDTTQYVGNNTSADKLKAIKLANVCSGDERDVAFELHN